MTKKQQQIFIVRAFGFYLFFADLFPCSPCHYRINGEVSGTRTQYVGETAVLLPEKRLLAPPSPPMLVLVPTGKSSFNATCAQSAVCERSASAFSKIFAEMRNNTLLSLLSQRPLAKIIPDYSPCYACQKKQQHELLRLSR